MGCRAFLIAMLVAVPTLVQSAGLTRFEIPADEHGPAIRVVQWSPCATPATPIKLGPFIMPAVRDCPITGGDLPLIVISHGFGGTALSHHDTAETLADLGFIVVAPEHPDDSAFNAEREHNLKALTTRPLDVKRLIDHMLGPSPSASRIDGRRIGFFGFSRGGYTGLVLAGAKPDLSLLRRRCADPTGASCPALGSQAVPSRPLVADPRIGAFVIADPLASVFRAAESLAGITAPIQLWGSERGGDGVSPTDLAVIARELPGGPPLHTVPNAGHFAFLTPCPDALKQSLPELCIDSPGFDRVAFHRAFNQEVHSFLRDRLGQAGRR